MTAATVSERVIVARALASDAAGAEVIRGFGAAGIPSILLKGATLAEWLYPEEARPYVDTDLLVPARCAGAAADVLTQHGFARYPRFVSPHAHPWQRADDGAEIDLHITVWGTNRTPEMLWRELQGWLTSGTICGTRATVLSLPARALFVALHAAQHRDNLRKPREDLRRALQVTPIEIWREAERLADRLWALGEMTDGLLLDPRGPAVLERLPLARASASRRRGGPRLAVAMARVRSAPGVRAKAQVLSRALVRRGGNR